MNNLVVISKEDLQALIIDSVNVCLKHHIPPPKPEADDKRFISRTQAAKKLGICLAKLDQLAKAGDMQRYRNGGIVRFLESDIDTFLTTFQKGKRKLPIPV